MKIAQVASEYFPYIKTGGLADAVGSLAGALARRGHEVSVFLPGYRAVLAAPPAVDAPVVLRLRVEMGDVFLSGEVRRFSPAPNLTVYLICRDEFFDRSHAYGNAERDYEDNHHRFMFFCKAVVEAMRVLRFNADIVHAHDWQTGLLPLMLRHAEQRYGDLLAMKTLFTVHNLAFQGVFPLRSFRRTNLPEELMGIDGVEFYGQMSMMKGGLLYADRVTTVSPRYAQEIQTPEFGCGLEGVVATRADDLVGITNGIDNTVWNPATDKLLPARYSAAELAGKAKCRVELLVRGGFDPAYKGPVFGLVARLTAQKGVDLILANRDFFAHEDLRLVLLGQGEPELERGLRELQAAVPRKLVLTTRHDEGMAHLVEAGADFFLMPSRFEPCGLNQMYSQAYGAVPLAARVGGLVDTVTDIDAEPRQGTGILFAPTVEGLRVALGRALALYRQPKVYSEVQARAMRRDFSWDRVVLNYERLYEETL
jgi:starch synthase